MDLLDYVNELSPDEVSEIADIVGATAEVDVGMLDDENPDAVTDEMRHLAIECAKLGQQLSQRLMAFNEAKIKAGRNNPLK